MSKGNLNDVEVSIDRSCGREKRGRDASTTSARWVFAAALPRNPPGPWHVRGCDRPILLRVSTFSHRYAATIGYVSSREVSCRFNCTDQKAAAASRKSISVRRQQG